MIDRSNALLKAFLNHIPEPVIVLNFRQSEILDSNQAYKDLLNQQSDIGSEESISFLRLFNKTEVEEVKLALSKALETGEKVAVKTKIAAVPNAYYEIDITPIQDDVTQAAEEVICTLRKTDEHLRDLLVQLTERENKFKGFFEQAPMGMCILKGKELITEYANENILAIWGKTKSEIIGKPQEIARPELSVHSGILTKVKRIFDTGEQLILNDLKYSTPAGDGYSVAMFQPLKNEHGAVTSILVIVYDVTEQINFRTELLRAKDILKLAMDASGMGSWNVDLNSKRLFLSERAQEIYVVNHNQLSINEAKLLIVDKDMDYVSTEIRKALHHKASFNIEYQIKLKGTQDTKWLRSTGKAYYNEEGRPMYIAGAVLDITEIKHDELRKNDFISMVSHELRTPLTSLSAYIQLLQYKLKQGTDLFAIQTLEKVGIQLKRMSLMIDGFLNVSLLESGKISLRKTDFDLIGLIKLIAEENRVILPTHFIQVIGESQIIVHADKDKIGNVLNNLIGNAAKYSKKESLIAIKCETNKSNVIVSIEDEGIGIKNSDIHKLFDRFFRVESPDTKTISGFGVGLYICAEIIHQHGGQIWAESELKQGSTFYFSLPL